MKTFPKKVSGYKRLCTKCCEATETVVLGLLSGVVNRDVQTLLNQHFLSPTFSSFLFSLDEEQKDKATFPPSRRLLSAAPKHKNNGRVSDVLTWIHSCRDAQFQNHFVHLYCDLLFLPSLPVSLPTICFSSDSLSEKTIRFYFSLPSSFSSTFTFRTFSTFPNLSLNRRSSAHDQDV